MKSVFPGKVIRFCFLGLYIFVAGVAQAQLISLPNVVKCKIGDDLSWADPSFNDDGWGNRQLGTSLKSESSKDIYAWFRIKIVIPSGMKAIAEHGKGIQLYLGKIDNVDQTFFNGKLAGQTGSFPPNYQTKWQANRLYIIPVSEVQWDKENVIAVRIFSPDAWVGMYEGPYKFGPVQWPNFISLEDSIIETANRGFRTEVKFINSRDEAFDGTIKYWVKDLNNRELFAETKQVQIQPVKGSESEIFFSDYQPSNEDIFRVSYLVTENSSPASVSSEQLYLANKQLKIEVGSEPKSVIENKVKDLYAAIPFQNQQQQGYMGERMDRNLTQRLYKLDETGVLDGYLQRPGHHPWAGEHIGKYLETASNVWKYTGDELLKTQLDRLMIQLVYSQLPDGYLGTYTPDEYWTSWDVWSHKYNLYGLLAYYKATGFKPAFEACIKMGDLLCTTFGNNPGQRDIIQAGTHMGMAATSVLDPMVELYKYTGDKKYLGFCYYILDAWEQDNGPKIISALNTTGKVTKVGNGKTYEMLSNFVGLLNLYRVTGDEKLLNPVLIAWNDIVANRLYITGTSSSHEYFQDDAVLPAGKKDNMGEGCVTTTWIQLNQQLFSLTGNLKYVEQIEKSVYNHLLAAENPETGCVSYYTPLMDKKTYTCHITCCQSSVPRGIAWIPGFSFGDLNSIPTIVSYEPAAYHQTLAVADKKDIELSIRVEGDFPQSGDVVIHINASETAIYPLAFRVPSWCINYTAKTGGKTYKGITNQTLVINKAWKPGEKIKISFQMPVQVLTGGKSYPGQVAFQRGPQVLALDSLLNIEVLRNCKLEPDQKITVELPFVKSNPNLLPAQWVGKQIYTVNIVDKTSSSLKQQFVLVPFADASQSGGDIKVWLPFAIKNK